MTNHNLADRIHFVLVSTTHAGNIGAAARAMKTMGFSSMRLVNPCRYLTQEAHVRASGAGGIMEQASVFPTLAEALSDCTHVFGTSGRHRSLEGGVQSARDAAQSAVTKCATRDTATVAVVFGQERSGLSNEELALCDQRLFIPSDPAFSSLNLGSAVQVIAYELRAALLSVSQEKLRAGNGAADSEIITADNESLEQFYQHLERTLIDIEFLDPENPRLLMPRLRRYFMRNRPDLTELNILRGLLSAAQKSAHRDKS